MEAISTITEGLFEMSTEGIGITAETERTSSTVTPAFGFINGYASDKKTYIVELTEDCFYIIGQALHVLKISEPDNQLIALCLEELSNQTNCVSITPTLHKVYENVLDAPVTTMRTKQVAYARYDRGKKIL
jgi:hypothetical protein